MPEYVYRAITDKGQIVRNKVEESSKQNLIKKLKGNGLTPIQIIQTSYRSKKQKKQKKNVKGAQEVLKMLDTDSIINRTPKRKPTAVETINLMLAASEKITQRDLVIFTQNFYLLKKANFNNIHALDTVIQSTENMSLRGVLEDILAGVQGRRLYVYNNGILFQYIPNNLYKYDKSRGTFRRIS